MWYSTSNSLACQFLNLFISSDFFFPVHVSHSHFMPCKLSPPFNILSPKLLIQMWHTLTTTFQVAGSTSPTITITDPTYSTFFFLFIKVFFHFLPYLTQVAQSITAVPLLPTPQISCLTMMLLLMRRMMFLYSYSQNTTNSQ